MGNQRFSLASLIIILAFFTILAFKVSFGAPTVHPFFYVYGMAVTSVLMTLFAVVWLKYEDPYLKAFHKNLSRARQPMVSLLVAVKNEEEIIDQCVQSLINSDYPNKEVIFINDGSTDATGAILKRYGRKGLIQVIDLKKNVGKKRALAKGMLRAKGDIFAFSDSDSVLAPDAISKIVTIFQDDPEVGAVSGHCRALNRDTNLLTKIQDSWYEGQFSIRKAFESIFGCVSCVSGPLAVFRRSAIFNLIPAWENDSFLGQEFKFATDRTLTGFALGSNYIAPDLKRKYADSPFVQLEDHEPFDWKVVYCKSAKAWTKVPDNFRLFIKQQVRWKKSFIRNMFFTGKFYWRKPFLAALVYYLHILFVLVGPFIAFRHLIYLPSQGNLYAAALYLGGIAFVGFMFGLAYKLENKDDHYWIYRPLMSLMSNLLLCWLIFYSIATIKKMVWARG